MAWSQSRGSSSSITKPAEVEAIHDNSLVSGKTTFFEAVFFESIMEVI
jgi:hypothetical protein